MALSLFRLIAAVARTEVIANTLGAFTLLLIVTLGGFIIAKGTINSFNLSHNNLHVADYYPSCVWNKLSNDFII